MPQGTPLSQYLRARRALVRPEDAGLPRGRRRRVAGLRREELAMLAGISPNYYLRLEQGRDRRPSAQVIDALARALQLDADATAFLHSLARPEPPPRDRLHVERERAPASMEWLIHSWRNTPAFIHDRRMDILAANRLALALTPALRPGANAVWVTFMDPDHRRLYDDWEAAARASTARLRSLVGRDVDDPRLCELVRDLSERSDEFRSLWARHDIQVTAAPPRVYNHPVVGRLELHPQLLAIGGTDGQALCIRHTEPETPSERALKRLADLAHAEPDPASGRDSGALANAG